MPVNYRFNPFTQQVAPVSRTETLVIPNTAPYMVRLSEVPDKTNPSTVTISGFTEVASTPAAGQFWCDYNTVIDGWNTGLILFNFADAGRQITVSYKGIGAIIDANNITPNGVVITTSGPWIAPLGCFKAKITLVNGGGNGGAGGAGGAGGYGGGGGGGGGNAGGIKTIWIYDIIQGRSYNVIVGGPSGQSSFDGSVGDNYCPNGEPGENSVAGSAGGAGGAGGNGEDGYTDRKTVYASAGTAGTPRAGGGAAGGAGGAAGKGYGAGGGGGGGGGYNCNAGAGGLGAQGCVIIEY